MGKLTIDPTEALNKANIIRKNANRVNEILTGISEQMQRIDDEGEGIYQGTSKAHELREQLNVIKTNFEPIYNQMLAFAGQIEAEANAALNQ